MKEMAIVFISAVFSSSILTIPRTLATEVQTPSAWLSIVINGIVMLIAITMYTRLQRHFPGETLLQFFSKGKFGKWGTKLFGSILVIYFIINIALVARIWKFP